MRRSSGSRVAQTTAATRAWPAAFGWMPSENISSGSPPTPSSRNGISRAPLFPARRGKMSRNSPGVVRPEVGGKLHPGDHQLDPGVLLLCPRQNGGEVALGLLQGQAAQPVVAPQLEDEDVDRPAQHPVDAAQAGGAGLAVEAGVDDAEVPPQRVDAGLHEGGVGLLAIQAVPRGQAVAEEEDGARAVADSRGRRVGVSARHGETESRAQKGRSPRRRNPLEGCVSPRGMPALIFAMPSTGYFTLSRLTRSSRYTPGMPCRVSNSLGIASGVRFPFRPGNRGR